MAVVTVSSSTTSPTCVDLSELSISKTHAPDPRPPESTLTYTLTVTNHGPGIAAGSR